MQKSRSPLQSMVYAALLTTLSIVLTRFLSIGVPIGGIIGVRLGFGLLPIILAGMMLGPWYGLAVGAIADVIGAVLFPMGTFFPGFTLSSALTGFIPGLFFLKRSLDHMPTLLLSNTITLAVNSALLNTLWLCIMTGKGVWVFLLPRLVSTGIMIPVSTMAIWGITRVLRQREFLK